MVSKTVVNLLLYQNIPMWIKYKITPRSESELADDEGVELFSLRGLRLDVSLAGQYQESIGGLATRQSENGGRNVDFFDRLIRTFRRGLTVKTVRSPRILHLVFFIRDSR